MGGPEINNCWWWSSTAASLILGTFSLSFLCLLLPHPALAGFFDGKGLLPTGRAWQILCQLWFFTEAQTRWQLVEADLDPLSSADGGRFSSNRQQAECPFNTG